MAKIWQEAGSTNHINFLLKLFGFFIVKMIKKMFIINIINIYNNYLISLHLISSISESDLV